MSGGYWKYQGWGTPCVMCDWPLKPIQNNIAYKLLCFKKR